MRVTFLGHAGLFVETARGSILCDPWFNPAYFASWFPFPDNGQVPRDRLAQPTYLYISHLHHDHFDPEFLATHVSKDTTVLLPDYPIGKLERELRALGFSRFIQTTNSTTVAVDGLRFTITAMVAPVDGPLGDSSLIVDDGQTRILDQNDSRPVDLDRLCSFGPFDVHFVQFSGAIWYPMVYLYPEKMMQVLGRKKRENEIARALRYVEQIGGATVIPSAGPPCFLDDDLYSFNDFDRDPANTFPDQSAFLDYMRAHGTQNGQLMIPGSVASITPGSCTIEHPMAQERVDEIFTDKRAYLDAYQARMRPTIAAAKASWPRGQVDIVAELRAWFEPLLRIGDLTCVGINGRVLIEYGHEGLVIDFQRREVYPWAGQEWEYRFRMDPALLEWCIIQHAEDWINEIFLSCRFESERKGPYNEFVYNFFKCLAPERLEYAEGYYAEREPEQQFWEADGYRIQRRCPHMKADLTRFGHIEDGVLTCTMHGWQFDVATGRCLTSDDRKLFSQPLVADASTASQSPAALATPPSIPCKDCWYREGQLTRTSEGVETRATSGGATDAGTTDA